MFYSWMCYRYFFISGKVFDFSSTRHSFSKTTFSMKLVPGSTPLPGLHKDHRYLAAHVTTMKMTAPQPVAGILLARNKRQAS